MVGKGLRPFQAKLFVRKQPVQGYLHFDTEFRCSVFCGISLKSLLIQCHVIVLSVPVSVAAPLALFNRYPHIVATRQA